MIWRMEKGTPEVSSTMSAAAHKSNIDLSATRTPQSRMTPRNCHELQTFQVPNNTNFGIKRCCGTRGLRSAHAACASGLTGSQAAISPATRRTSQLRAFSAAGGRATRRAPTSAATLPILEGNRVPQALTCRRWEAGRRVPPTWHPSEMPAERNVRSPFGLLLTLLRCIYKVVIHYFLHHLHCV